MNTPVSVFVYGSLREMAGVRRGEALPVELENPIPVRRVLAAGGVSPGQVQLVMINHKTVSLEALVHPGDRVSVFPREYPIFADWKDFRVP